jgi:hypothetical protein
MNGSVNVIDEQKFQEVKQQRRGNQGEWAFVVFDEALFVDCLTIAGVRVAPLLDGSGRYVATWKDGVGRDRLSVCGKYGPPAIQYRNLKHEQETN